MAYDFLIVDRSATMRALVKRAIRQSEFAGGKVHEADTAVDALDVLRHHHVDLVLIDPLLPDMDGMELVGRIATEPDTRGIPVVVMSARTGEEKRVGRGVKGRLRKPFTPEAFREVVGAVLEPTHV